MKCGSPDHWAIACDQAENWLKKLDEHHSAAPPPKTPVSLEQLFTKAAAQGGTAEALMARSTLDRLQAAAASMQPETPSLTQLQFDKFMSTSTVQRNTDKRLDQMTSSLESQGTRLTQVAGEIGGVRE